MLILLYFIHLMHCNPLKYKITSRPLQKQQLIFYFAQKFAKKSKPKKTKSPPHRSKTEPTSHHTISLISKSKPILSFKTSNDANKNSLSNIQILKKEVQYLQQENIEKYEMKSRNLEITKDQSAKNTAKSQSKDNLHKTTIENWKKLLVQRQITSKLTTKRRVNTTIANFTPLFHQGEVIQFSNNKIMNANTLCLPRRQNTTSVARKYFGSTKKINTHHSQIGFSQRPLKNERIRQKTITTLSFSTYNL